MLVDPFCTFEGIYYPWIFELEMLIKSAYPLSTGLIEYPCMNRNKYVNRKHKKLGIHIHFDEKTFSSCYNCKFYQKGLRAKKILLLLRPRKPKKKVVQKGMAEV